MVLFTVQVTVWVEPCVQDIPATACEVTSKGPTVPLTVITVASWPVWPPPTTLSLPVKVKFKVLATVEVASQVEEIEFPKTVCKAGKYL